MSKREDTNAAIDRGITREALTLWRGLVELDEYMSEGDNMGMVITEIRMQGPEMRQGGYLAIVKAIDESRKPFVAFRSGSTVKEVLGKITTDLESGNLVFKEEEPWKPKGKG
jgi:hypothetical protein